ncbi:5-formyltetrahydrofolate cyclo-ligase [Leptodesmis sichuanensis]|uniref:5-formyltetrahydrofolate cyclo-ligase n=1 Tax=Leptodesmis sichuanensis TaxID=2906798 RepID=UPI001F1B5F3A|nr:5-formyltetrahydrofolate cyclo-ligase [Leptodesmis sichuanensis]UIE38838.1 5-formyltetrahydrofolate cyclo-ligase [Leptodesmis sichuanensis A121]
MNKAELRKALLQKRQAIAPEEWQQKSLQLCHHLQNSSWFRSARTILAYFSVRQEPDLSSLFAHPKIWGISRCVGKELHWHHWLPDGSFPLQTGPYGILEPHPDAPLIEPEGVDLLLVPAIACDHQGYRLGYGGGFYDRLLSAPGWSTKVAIGIVFESARLPKLPRDSWDCPLTAVCTEAGLFFEKKLVS